MQERLAARKNATSDAPVIAQTLLHGDSLVHRRREVPLAGERVSQSSEMKGDDLRGGTYAWPIPWPRRKQTKKHSLKIWQNGRGMTDFARQMAPFSLDFGACARESGRMTDFALQM